MVHNPIISWLEAQPYPLTGDNALLSSNLQLMVIDWMEVLPGQVTAGELPSRIQGL